MKTHVAILLALSIASSCLLSFAVVSADGASVPLVAEQVTASGDETPARTEDAAVASLTTLGHQADISAMTFSGDWLARRAMTLFGGGTGVVSVKFLFFVAFVFLLYYILPKKTQPYVLLLASVVFYLTFRPVSILFLTASAMSVYVAALLVEFKWHEKIVLPLVVVVNIGLLAFAKYGTCLFSGISIIVPLGISFYTLQAVAYLVDVGRGKFKAERNPLKFFLFISFFPIIMQGPISRYDQLSGQLWCRHRFSIIALRNGLQLVLWGFFKKMVIADRAAIFVDYVFAPGANCAGFLVVLAAVLYSVQIYADFSGCVDISRGIAEALGIDLIKNFNHPYFAVSVKDFWRRWHISLSSWLKDYVYIPLGGNRKGEFRKNLNILVVFAVSGLWHGTGLNFFIWGLLHGIYQIADALTVRAREAIWRFASVNTDTWSFQFGRKLVTFAAVTFAWIFFRSPTTFDAVSLIDKSFVFNPWVLTDGTLLKQGLDGVDWCVLALSVGMLFGVSCLQERMSVREALSRQMLWFRWLFIIGGLLATLVLGIYGPGYSASQFIYMQF